MNEPTTPLPPPRSLPPVEPRCAWPPLHRVERRQEGAELALLTALRPELGWPRQWAWLPVRETPAGYEPLQPGSPLREQVRLRDFEMAGQSHPGEALRCRLPLDEVPAEPGTGLLCLLLYADLRGQWIAAEHRALSADEELEAARPRWPWARWSCATPSCPAPSRTRPRRARRASASSWPPASTRRACSMRARGPSAIRAAPARWTPPWPAWWTSPAIRPRAAPAPCC
ncbi:MAG TPA: hypothetical protein VK195_19850 [Burkholderiaceae bacterium]|nr:hypothetical protein [Burkholderiaceae bacterium]